MKPRGSAAATDQIAGGGSAPDVLASADAGGRVIRGSAYRAAANVAGVLVGLDWIEIVRRA